MIPVCLNLGLRGVFLRFLDFSAVGEQRTFPAIRIGHIDFRTPLDNLELLGCLHEIT